MNYGELRKLDFVILSVAPLPQNDEADFIPSPPAG